ncbi:MAG: bifunctional phosphopantothenoylcysteine decarboxylase/phosphopantothenate--cysteine ligase CoaBC [Gammaproteobacteria bacterium]|nr:bifunctional phosphopantothenoylcysteine decarboxylase/phosphopantothenate--cysteine ligase CoaBC [Gammaproteobacteria bacterium]
MQATLKKKILLGVTGGIAAYKSAELLRLLIKAGAEVRVAMTAAACEFVQPLTFQALSGQRVYTDIFDADAESAMSHIELARWADFMVIAPASADFIAKLNQGYGDNILLTLCLASKHQVAIAPAMNQQMYLNTATQDNLKSLAGRGTLIWGPDVGEQACGDVGPGRMLEADAILQMLTTHFLPGKLASRRLLITAGPTREAIDPVRYISNHSSGKMGYALAQAAQLAGADVTLVSGPVNLSPPMKVKSISVNSALEMHDAVMAGVAETDIFIACAAVADYRVAQQAQQKIKKSADQLQLSLVKNPDIVSAVAACSNSPFCVGFAAETENLVANAMDKLKRKNLDMIAANLVGNVNTGFGHDSNELHLFWAGGQLRLALASKAIIAQQLIDQMADLYLESN